MSKVCNISITKMMIELIEIGYVKILKKIFKITDFILEKRIYMYKKISKYKIYSINLYRWDIYGGYLYK